MCQLSLSSSRPENLFRSLLAYPLARICRLATVSLVLGTLMACTTNESPSAQTDNSQERQNNAGLKESKTMPTKKTPTLSEDRASDAEASVVPGEIMRELVSAVAKDAGVNSGDVVLERAQRSTFSDGSLDCPEPGMAYNQVIVEGYWVVFRAAGEEYDMRVTNRGKFTRCQGATKRAPIRYDDT